MFFELIAVVLAGVGAAGIVMLINRTTGGALPKWAVPIAAGGAMIAATIASEYGWYDRTTGNMPEGMTVVATAESTAFYRPWTYVVPYVDRFVAVDVATARTNDKQPGWKLADVYYYQRWAAINKHPVMADCPGKRRAAITNGVSFGTDGQLNGATWHKADRDDKILSALCGGA